MLAKIEARPRNPISDEILTPCQDRMSHTLPSSRSLVHVASLPKNAKQYLPLAKRYQTLVVSYAAVTISVLPGPSATRQSFWRRRNDSLPHLLLLSLSFPYFAIDTLFHMQERRQWMLVTNASVPATFVNSPRAFRVSLLRLGARKGFGHLQTLLLSNR